MKIGKIRELLDSREAWDIDGDDLIKVQIGGNVYIREDKVDERQVITEKDVRKLWDKWRMESMEKVIEDLIVTELIKIKKDKQLSEELPKPDKSKKKKGNKSWWSTPEGMKQRMENRNRLKKMRAKKKLKKEEPEPSVKDKGTILGQVKLKNQNRNVYTNMWLELKAKIFDGEWHGTKEIMETIWPFMKHKTQASAKAYKDLYFTYAKQKGFTIEKNHEKGRKVLYKFTPKLVKTSNAGDNRDARRPSFFRKLG